MMRLKRRGSSARSGSALVEFTFAVVPFLALVTFLVNMAWNFYALANLQWAVRMGLRYGVTLTGTEAGSSNVTALIQNDIISKTLIPGFSKTYVNVSYYNPPDPAWTPYKSATPPPLSTPLAGAGAQGGDLVVVSVKGYILNPLVPVLFTGGGAKGYQANGQPMGVTAADLFEPCSDCPLLGN